MSDPPLGVPSIGQHQRRGMREVAMTEQQRYEVVRERRTPKRPRQERF